MVLTPLRERRKRATRVYVMRVLLLITLIVSVAYTAWFAPWTRPVRHIQTEITR